MTTLKVVDKHPPTNQLDSTFSFRIDSSLKAEFIGICKEEHLSGATILKRYISRCVRLGSVTLENR